VLIAYCSDGASYVGLLEVDEENLLLDVVDSEEIMSGETPVSTTISNITLEKIDFVDDATGSTYRHYILAYTDNGNAGKGTVAVLKVESDLIVTEMRTTFDGIANRGTYPETYSTSNISISVYGQLVAVAYTNSLGVSHEDVVEVWIFNGEGGGAGLSLLKSLDLNPGQNIVNLSIKSLNSLNYLVSYVGGNGQGYISFVKFTAMPDLLIEKLDDFILPLEVEEELTGLCLSAITESEAVITFGVLSGGIEKTKVMHIYILNNEIVSGVVNELNESLEGCVYSDKISSNVVLAISNNSSGESVLFLTTLGVEYSISYELNGGVNNESNPETYSVDSPTIVLEEPTKQGYKFLGWYDNTEFTGDAITQIATGSTGDITLYAKWIEIYTITYNGNSEFEGSVPLDETEYTSENNTAIIRGTGSGENELRVTGYVFTEWNTQSDGLGTSYQPGDTLTISSDITLYAIWEICNYTVMFDLNYEGSSPINLYVEYGEEITIPLPTREGYTFAGWWTSPECNTEGDNEMALQGGEIINVPPLGNDGAEVTLYARWEKFFVTFNANGGTGDDYQQGFVENQAQNLADIYTIGFVKNDYVFAGWAEATDSDIVLKDGELTTITEDTTLYAKWISPYTSFTSGTPTSYNFFNSLNGVDSLIRISEDTYFIAYSSEDSKGKAALVTIQDGIISIGTNFVFNDGTTGNITSILIDNTKVLVLYSDGGNNSYGTAVVITMSETNELDLAEQTEFIFKNSSTSQISVEKVGDQNNFVVCFKADNLGLVKILSVDQDGIIFRRATKQS
jgi:uncharacterized repeat protein (TIGR02543 family)